MKVYIAHSGKLFTVKVGSLTDKVSDLKAALVPKSDVATHDQILICEDGGTKLDQAMAIGDVPALRNPDAVVFLFNRQHLSTPPQPAKPIDPDAYDVKLPIPPKSTNHPLTSSTSPIIRALPEYEQHFAHDIEQAKAYQRGCDARARMCVKLVTEQHIQLRALETIIKNLNGHARHLSRSYNACQSAFSAQSSTHAQLTASFEDDLASLGRVELHPKLRAPPKRLTLLDCFEEKTIRTIYNQIRESFDSLSSKIRELGVSNIALLKRVPDEKATFHSPDLETIEIELKKWDGKKKQQETDLQVLDQDYKKVKGVVEETVKQLNSGGKAPDVSGNVQAFELQHTQHREEILKRSDSDDRWLKSLMVALTESSLKVQALFFHKLFEVRDVQQDVETAKSKIVVYREQMARQQQPWEQLVAMKQLPTIYKACLTEISRRRAYRRSFIAVGKEAEAKLLALRTTEIKQRDVFHATHKLPKGFLAFLNVRPTQYALTITDSDQPLPEIDDLFDPTASAGAALPGTAADGTSASASTALGDTKTDIGTAAATAASMGASAGGNSTSAGASSSAIASAVAAAIAAATAAAVEDKQQIDRLRAEIQMLKAERDISKPRTTAAGGAGGTATMTQTMLLRGANDSPNPVTLSPDQSFTTPPDSKAASPPGTATPAAAGAAAAAITAQQLQDALSTIDKKSLELAAALKRADQASAAAAAASAALTEQQTSAAAALEALRKQNADAATAASADSARYQKLETELRAQITALQTQLDTAKAAVAAAASVESQLRREVTTLQTTLADAGKKDKDWDEAEKKFVQKLRDSRERISQLEAGFDRQKKQVIEWQSKHEEVLKNNVHVELELKKEKEELKKVRAEHGTCSKLHSTLYDENKTLKKEKDKTQTEIAQHKSEIKALRDENATWKVELHTKLTYRSFESQDRALFLRNSNGFYEAAKNEPNYFLDLRNQKEYEKLGDRVVGRIVFVEEKLIASTAQNPYQLAIGTAFYRVIAEEFSPLLGKGGAGAGASAASVASPAAVDNKRNDK